jgi:hypothetical protein
VRGEGASEGEEVVGDVGGVGGFGGVKSILH